MTNYEAISICQTELNQIESRLRAIRDNSGEKTKKEINLALTFAGALNENLWAVNKALEKEKLGNEEL